MFQGVNELYALIKIIRGQDNYPKTDNSDNAGYLSVKALGEEGSDSASLFDFLPGFG
jgi:hypothetical protein